MKITRLPWQRTKKGDRFFILYPRLRIAPLLEQAIALRKGLMRTPLLPPLLYAREPVLELVGTGSGPFRLLSLKIYHSLIADLPKEGRASLKDRLRCAVVFLNELLLGLMQ